MNILKVQDTLKGLSDGQLSQEMKNPTGLAPQFLIMTEMQRREQMRAEASSKPQQDTTVADDLMGKMQKQQGIVGLPDDTIAGAAMRARITGMPQQAAGLVAQPSASMAPLAAPPAGPPPQMPQAQGMAPPPGMASGGIAGLKKGEPIRMADGVPYGGAVMGIGGNSGGEYFPPTVDITMLPVDALKREAESSPDPAYRQSAIAEINRRNSETVGGRAMSNVGDVAVGDIKLGTAIPRLALKAVGSGIGSAYDYLTAPANPKIELPAAPPASPAAATPLDTSNITPSEPAAEAQPMYRPDFNYESTAAPAAAAPEAQPASAYDQAIQRLLNPPAAAKVARSSPVSGAAEKGATNTQPQRDYASEYEAKVNDLMSKMGADPEKRREQNINNALMQAGLGIAGSKGPNFMNALVSGAQQGLGTYQTGNEDIRKQQLAGLAGQVTAAGELAGLRQKQDISAQDIASRQAIADKEAESRRLQYATEAASRANDVAARREEAIANILGRKEDILAQINAPGQDYRSIVAAYGPEKAPSAYMALQLKPVLTEQSAQVTNTINEIARVSATGTADPTYVKQLNERLDIERGRLRSLQDQFSELIGVPYAGSSASTSAPDPSKLQPGFLLHP
jgi:hypothetical protein